MILFSQEYENVSTKNATGNIIMLATYLVALVSVTGESISLIEHYDEENGCFDFGTPPKGM